MFQLLRHGSDRFPVRRSTDQVYTCTLNHQGNNWLRDECNEFAHWVPSKHNALIIVYIYKISHRWLISYWHNISKPDTETSRQLLSAKGIIVAWFKHEYASIMAAGGNQGKQGARALQPGVATSWGLYNTPTRRFKSRD